MRIFNAHCVGCLTTMISPNRLDSDAVKWVVFDQFRKGETMNNHEDLLTMDSVNLALFLAACGGCPPQKTVCVEGVGDCEYCWQKWLEAPHLEVMEDGNPLQLY